MDYLPTLYKTDKNGKRRFWKIWLIRGGDDTPPTIARTDGLVENSHHVIKQPVLKNITAKGKNSAYEQALLEMKRMWTRRTTVDGFAPEEEGGNATTTKAAVAMRPMLAKSYTGISGELSAAAERLLLNTDEGLSVQAKLDGIRAIASKKAENDEEYRLTSRNGKEFPHLKHIKKDLLKIKEGSFFLDGELYSHSAGGFQFVSEAVKVNRKAPHPDEKKAEYWVFDIIDETLPFSERLAILSDLFEKTDFKYVKLVLTHDKVKNADHIDALHTYYTRLNYEGVMVRANDSLYTPGYRSPDLLKYKKFEDEEWEIKDAYASSGGNQDGAIVWICIKNGDLTVSAKQMGPVEYTRKLFKQFQKRPLDFIGKMVNIRFNERTANGIPRFPRATAIVEDK